jgi:uncharacterized protein YuzE
MKITYFKDTDTLLVSFSNREIAVTKDLNENVLIELDKDGNIVSMTIEHARKQMEPGSFTYNQVENYPPK